MCLIELCIQLTNLRPYHLSQRPDELRRGIHAQLDRFFVNDLADGEPEGGFEALQLN
jgi:hypothetical protein